MGLLLLVDSPVRELCSAGIVDRIWNNLLYLLRKTLLQCLRDLGVTRGVRNLASVFVAVGIMECVRDFVLDAAGDLVNVNHRD